MRSFARLATVALLLAAGATAARADNEVMLQGFYWDAPQGWYRTLEKQVPEWEQSGFTSVWLPPPEKGAAGGTSNGYDVYDHYDLGEFSQKGSVATRWGTRSDLQSLLGSLHGAKIKALADLVMNQTSGADSQEVCPLDKKSRWTRYHYEHAPPAGAPSWATVESKLGHSVAHVATDAYLFDKSWVDFHPSHEHSDQTAPFHNWAFGADLCQQHDEVRVGLELWGDWLLNSVGYDGFRIDFAKGLDPGFLPEFLHDGSKSGRFAVMEVWDSVDAITQSVNATGASAFDFPLFFTLQGMCNDTAGKFDMRKLDGAGFVARNAKHAVTFAENHDTVRSSPIKTDNMLAYAYILTMEGLPCVFYADYYGGGLKAEIDPLIQMRRKLAGGTTSVLHKDPNLFVAQRNGSASAGGLVLVLNNDPKNWHGQSVTVNSSWAGKTLQDYTGRAKDQKVDASGRVQLWAPPRGYAIYAPEGVELTPVPTKSTSATPISAKLVAAPQPDEELQAPSVVQAAAARISNAIAAATPGWRATVPAIKPDDTVSGDGAPLPAAPEETTGAVQALGRAGLGQ